MIYLAFDVPKKIKQAVDTSNISELYGRNNKNIIRQPLSSANITQNSLNTKNVNSSDCSHIQPKISSPVIRRKRVSGNGTLLIKGQKWNITGANKLKIGIGWECENSECEIDVSAFMLSSDEKVPDESWFVFYGQERSPDNSVSYKSNRENSQSPDDAEMSICLDSVSQNICRIKLCVTIYEAFQKKFNFSIVKNLYIRLMDSTGNELAKYQADNLSSDITSLVLGEIYRYNNSWKFCPIGSGFKKDLAGFCNIYGVEIE